MRIMKHAEDILTEAGIKLTAMRILILKEIINYNGVFTLADLELQLDTVDKSTIFRTLSLLLEKDLLHEIDDGSGSKKYCLCTCHEEKHRLHVHFTCNLCQKTYCFKDVTIEHTPLPEAFQVTGANIVFKGICPECSKK